MESGVRACLGGVEKVDNTEQKWITPRGGCRRDWRRAGCSRRAASRARNYPEGTDVSATRVLLAVLDRS